MYIFFSHFEKGVGVNMSPQLLRKGGVPCTPCAAGMGLDWPYTKTPGSALRLTDCMLFFEGKRRRAWVRCRGQRERVSWGGVGVGHVGRREDGLRMGWRAAGQRGGGSQLFIDQGLGRLLKVAF